MLKSARKQETDPEGRMPLAEHLRELRNRLTKAMLGIVVVTIVAVFYSDQIMDVLSRPVPQCKNGLNDSSGGNCAVVAFNTLLSPFTTTIKVSLTAGVVVSSPIWLYQLWAFIAPGLHKNEKKYTYAFVATAVPLFTAGAYLAYVIMPVSMRVLLGITPDGSANLLQLDDVLDFVVRMVLVFGLAFELPLILIMVNMAGMVSGRRMLGWWRGVVMGVFVFGAVATPTTDPVGMFALAGPIIVLYFMAVGFSLLNDRRRAARNPDSQLDDDEASDLDLRPDPPEEIEPVTTRRALPEQVTGELPHVPARSSFDDVT